MMNKIYSSRLGCLRHQNGAVIVLVALLMTALIGVAAMAIDLSHLFWIRTELQNAADAGALAGAMGLYSADGTTIRQEANQEAYDTAMNNQRTSQPTCLFQVNWSGGNEGDVQRGHWSFTTRTFTPNASLVPVPLWNISEEDLDADLNFINAVRVITRRQAANPVPSFFARIAGILNFFVEARAVAYIGFAGPIAPGQIDQPIAICSDSITVGEEYSCNIGRMINSGSDPSSSNTAGWTSFYQGDGVCSGTDSNELNALVCSGGNPEEINKEPIATTGGANQVVFDNLRDCWLQSSDNPPQPPDQFWDLTLPVVNCIGNNVGNCPEVVGAVTVNMIWMTEAGTAKPEDSPSDMEDWHWDTARAIDEEIDEDGCKDLDEKIGTPTDPEGPWSNYLNYTEGMARWDCFVRHFNLKNADGSDATFDKKSMYFVPDCNPHELGGHTGGDNFGVLAKYPVLVE